MKFPKLETLNKLIKRKRESSSYYNSITCTVTFLSYILEIRNGDIELRCYDLNNKRIMFKLQDVLSTAANAYIISNDSDWLHILKPFDVETGDIISLNNSEIEFGTEEEYFQYQLLLSGNELAAYIYMMEAKSYDVGFYIRCNIRYNYDFSFFDTLVDEYRGILDEK